MRTINLYLLLLTAVSCMAAGPAFDVRPQGGGSCEIAKFETGVLLFSDRTYTLATSPEALKGRPFMRAGIDGTRVKCTAAGEVIALTPPEMPRATSIAATLLAYGFVKAPDIPTFQLFNKNEYEKVNAYRKTVKVGETLKLGKWCILIGVEKINEVPLEPYQANWRTNSGETLYNGIVLPVEWPPEEIDTRSDAPMPVPYLENPPAAISIDTGRQLFVDDFLIDTTDLLHIYHLPEKHPANPVLTCETALERQTDIVGGVCRPCVWWHPEKQLFHMWYQAGTYFRGTLALATSPDGIHWTRPTLDVNPGTNQALPLGFQPDSYGLVPDWECRDVTQRFKLFSTNPWPSQPASCWVSTDGIHWTNQTKTGTAVGDRSSMFYNPFRKRWIYSVRTSFRGRSRHYRESADFLQGASWTQLDLVPWLAADCLDAPEPGYKHKTQLYNFDAVAYESVMLGFFELHRGPENPRCAKMGLPKLNEISFGYSRDGFHFSRPDRRAHIPASRKDDWERGFIESGGNICVIVGDRLHFYYSGCRGNMDGAIRPDGSLNSHCMYDPNAIGLATLRRDGFASLNAGASTGHITTRPLLFSGKHLFVNADCPEGELRAEIIDADGKAIAPFTLENCRPFTGDKTSVPITWQGAEDLATLAGKAVSLRFALRRGALYSFWVSRDAKGHSGGFVAGGGLGYTGHRDL